MTQIINYLKAAGMKRSQDFRRLVNNLRLSNFLS